MNLKLKIGNIMPNAGGQTARIVGALLDSGGNIVGEATFSVPTEDVAEYEDPNSQPGVIKYLVPESALDVTIT